MSQYLLYSCGADCRNTDMLFGRFPMFLTASFGHLEIVQWLSHVDGAHDDIQKVTRNGLSPLRIAFIKDHGVVVQWLILNRTLSPGNVDGVIALMTRR